MASSRRGILAITTEFPWPLNTGGHLRTFHLLRALADAFEVVLITTVAHERQADIAAVRDIGVDVRAAPISQRTHVGELRRACTAIARREPYVFFHRHVWPAIWRELSCSTHQWSPDAVYFDQLDAFLYADGVTGIPSVIDLHNVYSTLLYRTAEEHVTWPMAALLRHEALLVKRIERRAIGTADLTLSVSTDDADVFRSWGARKVVVVSNGVDCKAYGGLPTGRALNDVPVVLYVGALCWPPNVAAARFLALSLLPRLRQRYPRARLTIVGRDPPSGVLALREHAGVEVHANVPDVCPYLHKASILAVPLEAGGGTRLKILEAFAAGLPVVSTAVGCEGLDVSDGVHLLVADRTAMAERIITLLDAPALGSYLAANARRLAETLYDWHAVGRTAVAAIRSVVHGGAKAYGVGAR